MPQGTVKLSGAQISRNRDDEAVLFDDAVHSTHAVRPVGCWEQKDTKIAVDKPAGAST